MFHMYLDMSLKIFRFTKFLVAQMTQEGLLACMRPDVVGEESLSPKMFVAYMAIVWFLSRMDHQMSLQVAAITEVFVTF